MGFVARLASLAGLAERMTILRAFCVHDHLVESLMVYEQLVLCQFDIIHLKCVVLLLRNLDVSKYSIVEGLGVKDLIVGFLETRFLEFCLLGVLGVEGLVFLGAVPNCLKTSVLELHQIGALAF
jgi:hypothetical protein